MQWAFPSSYTHTHTHARPTQSPQLGEKCPASRCVSAGEVADSSCTTTCSHVLELKPPVATGTCYKRSSDFLPLFFRRILRMGDTRSHSSKWRVSICLTPLNVLKMWESSSAGSTLLVARLQLREASLRPLLCKSAGSGWLFCMLWFMVHANISELLLLFSCQSWPPSLWWNVYISRCLHSHLVWSCLIRNHPQLSEVFLGWTRQFLTF